MKKGFTLVELSIVLVIVALIIAGILVGQNLISNSERQAVVKEFQKYNTAIGSFKQQYDALPGDIDNWTTYFSSSTTANGDGNGYIDQYFDAECMQNLKMLKEAEIINEVVTNNEWVFMLPSQYKKSRYFICSTRDDLDVSHGYSSVTNDYTIYEKKGNYISLVSILNPGSVAAEGPLNAEAASYIDKKIDDGKASSGNVVAIRGFGTAAYQTTGCIDGSAAGFLTAAEGTLNYDLDNKTKACRLIYWLHHYD